MGSSRWRTLAALSACLLAALGGAQPEREGLLSAELLEAIAGRGHCVAHELNTPGQGIFIAGSGIHIAGSGIHIAGSAGGLIRGSITFTDPDRHYPNTTLVPLAVDAHNSPAQLPPLQGITMDRDALIVVADDFAGGHYELPAALHGLNADLTTLAELTSLAKSGELSHGALVMHHLNALIRATGHFELEDAPAGGPAHWVHDSGHRLVVAGLDLSQAAYARNTSSVETPSITADDVFNALVEGVGVIVAGVPGFEPGSIAVNMSWVFLPCATVEAFLRDRGEFMTFQDYLRGVLSVDPDLENVVIRDVIDSLREVSHTGLENWLEHGRHTLGPARVAFVAASGNFSMDYQMFPAAWSHVVGAAVEKVEDREFPGRYSNEGDVTVPGEWFSYQPLLPTWTLGGATELSYAGTSYAAPLVSLYAALDAATASPACWSASAPPPLNKATLTPDDPGDEELVKAVGNC